MIAVSRHFGALVAILLLAGAARAEVPADGTAKLEAAASDFRALVAGKKPGELPRFADDTDRKMLTAFWDADAIVGSPPYSARDIPALLEILGGLADLLRTYVFHAEPGKQADTISNEALYQDELVRTLAVLIRVNAAQMEAAADFFGDLPAEDFNATRREGLSKMRLGLVQVVDGSVLAMKNPKLSLANKGIMAAAWSSYLPILSQGIRPADRTAVTSSLRTALDQLDPADRGALAATIEAVERLGCERLCLVE